MDRINHNTATPDRMFTAGNPAASIPATVMTPAFANGVQEELCNVIEAAGITLDPEDDTQLDQAIDAKIASATPGAATEETAGIAQLATEAEALAGTDDATIITPLKLAAALAALGGADVDEFYIDAGSMSPAITGGAASGQLESTTNRVNRQYMSFRGDTANTIAQFSARLPSNWDAGTVRAKLLWEPAAGASAGDEVRWLFSAVAVGNDDALDAAFGTPVNIDDAAIAAGDAHETPASAAMTIGGTPAVGDLVTFKIERDYDYGSQPLAEHARLLGMVIQYGVSGTITAW